MVLTQTKSQRKKCFTFWSFRRSLNGPCLSIAIFNEEKEAQELREKTYQAGGRTGAYI